MTIEEKAQAYDKAIKVIKNNLDALNEITETGAETVNIQAIKNCFYRAFPEFKESENEIMRKNIKIALMSMEDNLSDFYSTHHTSQKELLAWLEKQGEHLENHDDEDILQRFSFYSYKDEPNIIYLSGLYINVEHQNKGIGTKILAIADEVAVRMGCNVIRLKTEIGSNAERLYRRNGYNIFQIEGNQVWLEKQCEKIPVVEFNAKDWYISKVDGKIYNAKFMEKTPTNQVRKLEIEKAAMSATGIIEQEEWFIKGAEWSDKNPCYISSEKPNKQKPINNQFTPEQAGVLDKHIDKFLGQEPADKVEPKFHEGDFVVDNCGYVWKIKGVLNRFYVLEGVEGGESRPTIEWVNKTFHLWTIKDAKEGDVLCYKDEISLYKHDIKNCTQQEPTFGGFVYHCCNDGKRFIMDSLYSLTEQDKIDIHPATKEQRDLLFAKMKEAGYELDADKKKLKKIEQTAAGWSEEDKKELKVIIDELKKYVMFKQYGTPLSVNDISWLEELPSRFITQQQLEWSEEDKYLLDETIQHLESLIRVDKVKHCACDVQYYQRDIDWLKSLRPQPHWEPAKWSEEDNVMLKNTLALIETVEDINKSKDGFLDVKTWLKSLKDKYTWKPSDEQMETLRYACGGNYVNLGILESLYKELKQLKKL